MNNQLAFGKFGRYSVSIACPRKCNSLLLEIVAKSYISQPNISKKYMYLAVLAHMSQQ